ncbi:hypothetical protein EMPS_01241 [Entomortierella parvispora]|uniref:Galactose oxidase n=1 Tax=Entomortierella parvispora TaxID=205924 RepID=A0A9P3H2H4_9FUNG|nr:hypothetical protein EMPS_01241 [Entomortierella parvispora]
MRKDICSRRRLRRRLLVVIGCSILALTVQTIVIPPSRWGHVSVLCGQTLYIHGGHTGVNPLSAPIGSDIYSLDVSTAFNGFSVPWVQLNAGPYATFHSASLLGSGNSLLGIYGGNTSFSSTTGSGSLNLYNTLTGQWTTPPAQVKDPPRREYHAAVTRLGDGTMFVFGGMILSQDLSSEVSTSELWSLGGYPPTTTNSTTATATGTATATASSQPSPPASASPISAPPGISPGMVGWQELRSPTSPMPGSLLTTTDRSSHTATILRSNGLVVVIGGISSGVLVSMSEIWVYDPAAGSWSVQAAAGAIPAQRRNHVAAADSNGQIYVHGGTDLGATSYYADLSILDTNSWTWNQPAMGGTAPTGRYSHAATMVGSNLIISFGLSAGGASNSLYILDTVANSWVSSYTPNNLTLTSTRPEDWPGYTPPPPQVSPPPSNNGTDPNPPKPSSSSKAGPVVGGILGAAAIAVVAVFALRRYRRNQQTMQQAAKVVGFYGPSTGVYSVGYDRRGSDLTNRSQNDPYRPTGMAFVTPGSSRPPSLTERMEQLWTGIVNASGGFLGAVRSKNVQDRSQSQRLRDVDDEDDESDRSSWRGLHSGAAISDQDIFLDAVHRARSRTGVLSPVFAPLQQPLTSSSPPPLSPRSPRMVSSNLSYGGMDAGSGTSASATSSTQFKPIEEEYNVEEGTPHGRAYSDGFENAMLEMDVQMLAVPRGRLFVVNPSNESLADMDFPSTRHSSNNPSTQETGEEYQAFDSQGSATS